MHADMVWRHPLSRQSVNIVFIILTISVYQMHTSTNIFPANNRFFLSLIFAESYVKLHYFVTILSLVTLLGSVCTQVR